MLSFRHIQRFRHGQKRSTGLPNSFKNKCKSGKSFHSYPSNQYQLYKSFNASISNNKKLKTLIFGSIFFSAIGMAAVNESNDEKIYVDEDEFLEEDVDDVDDEEIGSLHSTESVSPKEVLNDEESRLIRHLVNHYNDLYEKTVSKKEKQFEESLSALKETLHEQYVEELDKIRLIEEEKLLNELDSIYSVVSHFYSNSRKSLTNALRRMEYLSESKKYYDEKNKLHNQLSGVIATYLLLQQRLKEHPTLPFQPFLSIFAEQAKDFPSIMKSLDSIPKSASSNGLASQEELKSYFDRAIQSSRSISSVGQGAQTHDYVFAYVKEKMSLNQTKNEKDDLSKLSRAQLFFEKNQLRSCLEEIEALDDKPKEILSQFREKTKEHVLVETALSEISQEITEIINELINMQPPKF